MVRAGPRSSAESRFTKRLTNCHSLELTSPHGWGVPGRCGSRVPVAATHDLNSRFSATLLATQRCCPEDWLFATIDCSLKIVGPCRRRKGLSPRTGC